MSRGDVHPYIDLNHFAAYLRVRDDRAVVAAEQEAGARADKDDEVWLRFSLGEEVGEVERRVGAQVVRVGDCGAGL